MTPEASKFTRAERLRNGPQSGPGWHLEWAESAFSVDASGKPRRFQYVVLDGTFLPWEGLDDMRVDRGWISRAELEKQRKG